MKCLFKNLLKGETTLPVANVKMLNVILAQALTFIVQGAEGEWNFPQKQVHIVLPTDYPPNSNFYRVAAIGDKTQDPDDIVFAIRRVRIFPGGRAIRKQSFLDIDKQNGLLHFLQKPIEMQPLQDLLKEKTRQNVSLNVIVVGTTKSTQPKKLELVIFFKGDMASYCKEKSHTCFSHLNSQYQISENNSIGIPFDYLTNPDMPKACPNLSLVYNVTSGQDIVRIDRTRGTLSLLSELDAEEVKMIEFNVECYVENETYGMTGSIGVVDVNDNGPTTQNGNTSMAITRHILPGENFLNFAVNAIDKDSKEVNDLKVTIEDDSLNLFEVKSEKIYSNVGVEKSTFMNAEIQSKIPFIFPGNSYNFSVIIEDTTAPKENNRVHYNVYVFNNSESELKLNDIYEVNISRNAAKYARIMQLAFSPAHSKGFHFSEDESTLGITEKTGIIFVKEPSQLQSNLSTSLTKTIIWRSKNDAPKAWRTVHIVLNVEGPESSSKYECDQKWCSYYEDASRCETSCGLGSNMGHCQWRSGSAIKTGLSSDYATCSPDLATCPDGQCDELEQLESRLCPQDCARYFTGEVIVSRFGRGLQLAVGPCACPSPSRCNCVRKYFPSKLRYPDTKMAAKTLVSSSPIGVEVENITVIDFGNTNTMAEDDTSTGVDLIPVAGFLKDSKCGTACIILVSIGPCGLIVIIITLVAIKRITESQRSKHKFVGSHISLSAVPSDYVDERSNSIPDSRTTASDSSSSGKPSSDAKWEFPRSKLQLQNLLGEGEFGKVVKAQAWNIDGSKTYTTVAVKMLKENGGISEKQDLMSEFALLKEISHPNIIRLLGVCSEKTGPFYLIVEYAEMGSLRNYLRKRRRKNSCLNRRTPLYTNTIQNALPVEPQREYYRFPCERARVEPRHCQFHKEQLSFAWQIAKGMAYLADMKLVHRDLAARNILLAEGKVIKISDFGLSRDVYEGDTYLKRSKGRVPIKWMAIESLEDHIYTSRSDVWSFGIVMWEIIMQGATPYPGITPQRLYHLLKAGYRMSKPDSCPDEIYRLMRQCWRDVPHERPNFKELIIKLDFLLQDTVEYMDFVPCESAGSSSQLNHRANDAENYINDQNFSSNNIVQYTNVLVEEDEEDPESAEEEQEEIDLGNVFDQSKEQTPILLTTLQDTPS